MKQHAAEAAHLGLRRKGLAHRERVDRLGRERAGHVGRRHLDHLDVARLHAERLHRAKQNQPLVREPARNGDDACLADPERCESGPSFWTTTALP